MKMQGSAVLLPPAPSRKALALAYARSGWPVFPLHEMRPDGICSCGNLEDHATDRDGRRAKHSKGKHPRCPGGFKNATTDEARIVAWRDRWPEANIGIATGRAGGLLVLDVDRPHGFESLRSSPSCRRRSP
jgi:hypothetical protein